MPITVKEGDTLSELNEVWSNEGGTMCELDTVHSNEGGTLCEIHTSIPKSLTWSPTDKLTVLNNGFTINQFNGSASSTTRTSSSFRFNGNLTIVAGLNTTYYPLDYSENYGINVTLQVYSDSSGAWGNSDKYHYFSKPNDTNPITWSLSSGVLYRIQISPENIGSSGGSGSDTFTFSFSK